MTLSDGGESRVMAYRISSRRTRFVLIVRRERMRLAARTRGTRHAETARVQPTLSSRTSIFPQVCLECVLKRALRKIGGEGNSDMFRSLDMRASVRTFTTLQTEAQNGTFTPKRRGW